MKIDLGKVITSWTVWTNIILLALGLAGILSISPLVPKETAAFLITIAVPVLNLILRIFKTNDSLLKP